MSEFRIDQITNQSGSRGPDIAGITTFSATSGMVMPSGDTFRRNVLDDVVTDGLVLYLDAGNNTSYPGSGTTWYDLSENANSGTLVGGVGYDSGNGGSLSFDGVDDYVAVPRQSLLDLGTQLTICGFVQINRLDLFQPIFSTFDVENGVYTEGYLLAFSHTSQYGMDEKTLQFQFGQSAWRWNVYSSNGISINDNEYHFVAVTAVNLNTSSPNINFYIDENKVNATYWTGASTGPIRYSSTTQSIRIGSVYPASNPAYGTDYGEINAGQVSIYNRALTPQEIQQNYNALKGRYI